MALSTQSSDTTESEGSIMAEINITPLTDIFLVLLIIFMVTSSVMTQTGVTVNLPKASDATSQAQPEGVIVTLVPGGTVQINGKSIAQGDWASFQTAMKSAFSHTQSRLVILEGDRETFLGSAIQVMDEAKRAGAEQFAIATEPPKKEK